MNKTLIIIFLLTGWLFSSCEVLNVDPSHSMPADQAINDARGVERGILGCYDAMQGAGYYGRNFLVVGDLASDNLIWSGTTAGYDQIGNNNILADNTIVEGIWAGIYAGLNRINNVADRIPLIEDMSQDRKNQALAELYFLRALHHYDLFRLFGPVPIRIAPARGSEADLNVPRNSENEVLTQIVSDLGFAIDHLPQTLVRGRAGKPAAQALMARVALHVYYLTGNAAALTEAITLAGEVISHPGIELETDFSILFSGATSRESIFELDFNEQDRNRLAEYFFHTTLSGRYEFAPSQSLLESFAPGDLRKNVAVRMAGTNPYVAKYNDIETGTDNPYLLRLAEMYLIRAEAATLLQLDPAGIRSDINAIRQRAGLLPVTTSNHTALLLEIESQRQKEFAFEGHRWFDLTRTGRAMTLLPQLISPNQLLFPIPLSELLANEHQGMYQNPGY